MEKLLDASYKRDHDQFMEKLKECYQARGNKLGRIPTFGGQPLDLYALYNTVTSFGGINVVTEKKKWDQVFVALGFPPCTNAAYALRQHYARYLETFEKIYFLGEEADETTTQTDSLRLLSQPPKYRRMNQLPKITSVGEPLVQNFNRLMFSLQSGYPNEVDFALNICSLLSNVTNSIFSLAKCPQVLSLVLGHVGIWCQDDSFVDELCKQWHTENEGKNYFKFWKKSLTNNVSKEVLKESSLGLLHGTNVKEEDLLSTFFAGPPVKKFEANKNPEFTRISQIAIILYNFSFEPLNAMFMCHHDATKRFLLLAGSCKQNLIKKAALDTLDNISNHLIIGRREDPFNQQFLRVLHRFFKSDNKLIRVRGQSVLAKLASSEENRDILVDLLSKEIYKSLIETLYLPDICMVLYALDALYYLSGLCEETADDIVNVHGSIGVLISMSTVRAESFGNQAIEGYRIIENKSSIFTPKNQSWLKQQQRQAMLNRPPHPHTMMPGMHPGQLPQGPPMMHRPNMPPHILRPPGPPIGPYGVPAFNPRGHPQRMPNMLNQGIPPHGMPPHGMPPHSMPPHGMPPNSMPPHGMPPNSMVPHGMPPNSIPRHGMPPNSMPPHGMPPNSMPPHGMPPNSMPPHGMPPNSMAPHGMPPNSIPRHGMPPNSMPPHGMPPRGMSPHGMPPHGVPPSSMPQNPMSPKSISSASSNIQSAPHPQQNQNPSQVQRSDDEMIEFESDVFVAHWMSGFYEPHPANQITISFIYHDFTNICKELKRSEIITKEVFVNMIRAILPPNRVRFEDVNGDCILHGISRRQVPVQVHSKIPKAVYLQLVATGQLKPKLHASNSNSMQPPSQPAATPTSVKSSTPTEMYASILGDNKLSNSTECHAMIEKLKKEIQAHFMHFHGQRQYIQTIQTQAHMMQKQSPQPPPENVMKEIQVRIQGHYQQMQMHFQKLQQLNTLSEEVQSKLRTYECQSNPLNSSAKTPGLVNGQALTVPPPMPLLPDHKVDIEHGILSSSVTSNQSKTPRRGKSTRGKSKRNGKLDSPNRVNGQDGSPQSPFPPHQLPAPVVPFPFNNPFPSATSISQLPAGNHQPTRHPFGSPTANPTPPPQQQNSIALKNPFGQFPHMEALKTLYRNNIRSSSESSEQNSPSKPISPKENKSLQSIGSKIETSTGASPLPSTTSSSLNVVDDKEQSRVNGIDSKKQIEDDDKLSTDIETNSNLNDTTKCNGDIVHNGTLSESDRNQIHTNGNATCEEKERMSDLCIDVSLDSSKRKMNGDLSPVSQKKLKLGLLSSSTDKMNTENEIVVNRVNFVKDSPSKMDVDSLNETNAAKMINGDAPLLQMASIVAKATDEKEITCENVQADKQPACNVPQEQKQSSGETTQNEKINQDNRTDTEQVILGTESSTTVETNSTTNNVTNHLFLELSDKSSKTPSDTTPSTKSSFESHRSGGSSSTSSSANTPAEVKTEGEKSFLLLHGTQKVDGVYPCQWDRCSKHPFATINELLNHMVDCHAPVEGKMSRCKVKRCSSSHRPRGALICHFKEKHCQCATPDDIKRKQEFQIEEESPVTRSIRYTSTLILRNLIRKSTSGRDILSSFEYHLAQIAMSSSEATPAALDSLYEWWNTTSVSDEDDDDDENMVTIDEDIEVGEEQEVEENEEMERWNVQSSAVETPEVT